MDDIKKNIDEEIRLVSEAWAEKFLAQRRGILERRKINASGGLSDSLDHAVVKGGAEAAVSILIAFNDEGRIVEMRNLHVDKWGREAVTRVEDWIKKRGVNFFVPGFLEKYRLQSPPKDVLNRMAWGILVSRSGGKYRRRPWWNKSKTAAVTDLYNQAAVAALDKTAKGVAKSFKSNKYAKVTGRE